MEPDEDEQGFSEQMGDMGSDDTGYYGSQSNDMTPNEQNQGFTEPYIDELSDSISGGSEEELGLFDKGCYRYRETSEYETKRNLGLNVIGWVKIHDGACTKCEGQTWPDCCEPGDRDCEDSSDKSSSGSDIQDSYSQE
jgi:hypothetical protein